MEFIRVGFSQKMRLKVDACKRMVQAVNCVV